jgi:membrane protein YdbS with pleckstrin-like domain
VGPDAFEGVERYLLPTEQRVLAVRRHWSVLIGPVFLVVAATLLLFWLDDRLPPRLPYVRDVLLLGWVVLAGLLVWRLLEWRQGWFVVTDRRLLLRSGIITRTVGMMPLHKVTDMSYARPPIGQLLGYGVIVIESAGQDQAMHRISHLPHPDALYAEICELLFGPRPAAATMPPGFGQQLPPGYTPPNWR